MLKRQIVGEEKLAFNSINVSAVSRPNSYSHVATQVFKGFVGLCGLTALGGVAYWASSWFGGKGADAVSADSTAGAVGAAKTEKASVEVLAENDNGLVVNPPSSPASAVTRADIVEKYSITEPTEILVDVTQKQGALSSDNVDAGYVKQIEGKADAIFSTDDLVYRAKTSDAAATSASELSNTRRKFFGTADSLSSSTPTAPVLIHNQLSIGQGQAVSLTLDMLSVNATNIDPTTISYLNSNVEHGRFEYVFNQGVPISSFVHTEIINNFVRFVHDNALVAPSYQIAASIGGLSSVPQNATIIFDFAPVLSGNSLVISQGQEIFVSHTMLNATDVDTDLLTLQFISNNMQHGQFALATTGKAITQFSQAQVINKKIKFMHDGSFVAPAYQISVNDGNVTTESFAAAVTFYKAPNLLVNSLTVYQGQTVLVTNSTLHALSNVADSNPLVFTMQNLLHGKFSLVSNPNREIYDFTEQQIEASAVQFTHDDSQVAPYGLVSVSNGFAATKFVEMAVSFDIAPTLGANQLTIGQGETVIITNSMLSAADQDTDSGVLIFKIANLQHGQFSYRMLPPLATSVFVQEDIMASNISFTHDGGLVAPTYSVAVSDGLVAILSQPALITFLPKIEEATSNTVRNAVLSATLGGSFGLGLWIFKKYVNRKTSKEFAGNDIQNQVCLAMLKRIKVSGFLDYMSDAVIRDLRKAVSEIFATLLAFGVKLNLENITVIEQQKIVDEIVRQTEKVLLPEKTCCHGFVRFFKNYIVSEFTPEQIKASVNAIARAVKVALAKASLSATEMALARQGNEEVFIRNPLALIARSVASAGTETPSNASVSTSVLASTSATSLEQKDASVVAVSTSAVSNGEAEVGGGEVVMEVTEERLQAIREENRALLSKISEFEQVMKDNSVMGSML